MTSPHLILRFWLAVIMLSVLPAVLYPVSAQSPAQDLPDCVISRAGDLQLEIDDIVDNMPGEGSNGMVVPTSPQIVAWESLMEAVSQGDLTTACGVIATNSFPYHIIQYTDTGNDGETYLMLKEDMPISVGWGTYVLRPPEGLMRNLVFEAPHPGCEVHTENEGVQMFRETDARAMLVAGTHRCANTSYTSGGGTTTTCGEEEPFRTSDVAHSTQTMFHASHRALVVPGSKMTGVQLHGCSSTDCPDLFISNGTCTPGDLTQRLFANATAYCSNLAIDVADCMQPECPLVGTTNMQGRFTNGTYWSPSYDPYLEDPLGPSYPDQFLHMEQSREFRGDYSCLAMALKSTFPLSMQTTSPSQVYIPQISKGCDF